MWYTENPMIILKQKMSELCVYIYINANKKGENKHQDVCIYFLI